MGRSSRLAIACALLLGGAQVVAAQAKVEEARAHYDRANASYALGNYAKAADEFEKTFDLKPDPALLYNAAQAHRLGGNKTRALLLYQNYLRIYGAKIGNGGEVKRHIADLKAAIESEEHSKSALPMTPRSVETVEKPPVEKPPVVEKPVVEKPVVEKPVVIEKPAASPAEKPLTKRAWFWGTLAGGVVVVGTAIALGVTLGGGTARYPTPSLGHATAQ